MDKLAKYGTTCIVLINTLFGIVGLVLLVGGVMVKVGSNLIDDIGAHVLSGLAEKLPPGANVDLSDLKISDFVGEASGVFIGVGCGLLFVVFFAYCGACCQSRWMMIVYACLLSVIILGEVAVVIIFANDRNMIEGKLKAPMKDSLKEYYTGVPGTDGLSKGWNAIMQLLHCCGVDGSSDFQDAKLWTHAAIIAPDVCCKNITGCVTSQMEPRDYNTGCYSKVWALIEANRAITIGVASGLGAFQVILLCLVIWIIHQSKPNKVKPS